MTIKHFNSEEEMEESAARIEELCFEHLALKEAVSDAQKELEYAEETILITQSELKDAESALEERSNDLEELEQSLEEFVEANGLGVYHEKQSRNLKDSDSTERQES